MKLLFKALRWYSVLTLVSLVWLYFQKRLHWSLFVRLDPVPFWTDLGIGAGLGLMLILLSGFASRHFRWAQMLEAEFQGILTPLSPVPIILLGMSSGAAEEIFFRGALQGSAGLVASSILFGLAHLIPRRDLYPWALYALLVGFIFGCLVEIRHTLLPSILAHTLSNIVLIAQLNRKCSQG